MNQSRTMLLAAVASVIASVAIAGEPDFVARGNEPGWVVRKNADGLTFQPMDGAAATISPLPAPEVADGVEVYRATVDGKPFAVTIAKRVCVDTMSGMPHPASVSVVIGERRLEGCGGEPESLLVGEWTVSGLDGKPVAKGTEVSLKFEAGGHLSGGASCNRFFGGFKLTGEGLTIEQPGATMMMCDEPVMEQERMFLSILTGVSRFAIGADGSLVLHTNGGSSLTASRKG